ncbi:alpha/beta fold hydrolase [Streptomyces sp. MZ04]|uniref:alpha/beta fold hydrolase n=1 Tax=Streptomyces sp. MZ04 TaxID=2559236 RepID=UPI00107E9AF7|nr:alpha/beta fold hydrolase [Streptomyces sp. MZ04]TGA95337.1 alpha/beta fold hydrolase [Streptomyces sp. MZ04]
MNSARPAAFPSGSPEHGFPEHGFPEHGFPEHDVRLSDHVTRVLDRPADAPPADAPPADAPPADAPPADAPPADAPPSATPLVLVHALGLDRRMWAAVVAQLPPGRRVIAYDLRGHGRAAGAPHATTLHDLAADLAALLDALDIASAEVAGLSMGGAVAQTFAVDHPERVARLHLVATAGDPQPAYLERAAEAAAHGVGPQIAPTLERWFTPGFLAADGDEVRYARDSVAGADTAAWCASWRALATLDTREHLPSLSVPTRVVAGGEDPSTSPAMMRALADAVPDAEFLVIPKVRHLISLEAPRALADCLSRP